MRYKSFITQILLLAALITLFSACHSTVECKWPVITKETKPWTRWWWMGSAVNKADLTVALESYSKAGLGGVEITPIYGVKGYEDQFLDYLSPAWLSVFKHTLSEASRLDMGVDMANTTGWPFGGPWVTAADESKYVTYQNYKLKAGERLEKPLVFVQKPLLRALNRSTKLEEVKNPISANTNLQELALDQVRFPVELPIISVLAYGDNDHYLDITDKVDKTSSMLNWVAPAGNWDVYVLYQGYHGKMVERAGPAGEGKVIDHFSKKAITNYLAHFDSAFVDTDLSNLRSFFNDSYEVDDASGEANWTPQLFEEFQSRRGYDLKQYMPQLLSKTESEIGKRVRCDFRVTISELLEENFTVGWASWAHKNGKVIRNQSHGSPGNLIDLYAASDIPETEHAIIVKNKIASSAAHITGKKLVGCEAATWMDEHFYGTLGQAKSIADNFFLGGVNHLFYHGTTYSPQSDKWPGWMFYASVHFGPTNSIWQDFNTLNSYITRCQSFLQSGTADNDLLLYFPVYDAYSDYGRSLLRHFHGKLEGQHVGEVAEQLIENGYSFDYISDKYLTKATTNGTSVLVGSGEYKGILVPKVDYIPLETFHTLMKLAEAGVHIYFEGGLPTDVPGLKDIDGRRAELKKVSETLSFSDENGIKSANVGSGQISLSDSLELLLANSEVIREKISEKGLSFVRLSREEGKCYFILNRGESSFEGFLPLGRKFVDACLFNPMTQVFGKAKLGTANDLYVQLAPGESLIVQLLDANCSNPDYPIWEVFGNKINIGTNCTLEFVSGGSSIPVSRQLKTLESWSNMDDARYFSGTAKYTFSFDKSEIEADGFLLSLGDVRESARVVLNGKEVTTFIKAPFSCYIDDEMFELKNHLEVYVTNQMVNRMIELDRNDNTWKKFYNINFPGRRPESKGKGGLLTTENWLPIPSGLISEVDIQPARRK